jgi:hypothetical protein
VVEGGLVPAALEDAGIASDDLLARVTGDFFESRIDMEDCPVGIGQDNGLGRLLKGSKQPDSRTPDMESIIVF